MLLNLEEKSNKSCYEQVQFDQGNRAGNTVVKEIPVQCDSWEIKKEVNESKPSIRIKADSKNIQEILSNYWELNSLENGLKEWTVNKASEKLKSLSFSCQQKNLSGEKIEVFCIQREQIISS